MIHKKWTTTIFLIILLALFKLVSMQAVFVEKYYSQGLYPKIAWVLSGLSSKVPFSLGEMLILIGTLGLFIFVYRIFIKYRKNKPMLFIGSQKSRHSVQRLVSLILMVLVMFQLLWGLNYSRLPLKTILGMDVKPRQATELYEAMLWHVDQANALRAQMNPTESQAEYDIWQGYENLPEDFQPLKKVKGKAKGLQSSVIFSYAGIAGIYNPFLGEPNFNKLQVEYMHPVVQAHELAHLQGIAREDEANFTAVMVCLSHDSDFVKYSGHMLALIHLSNTLYAVDESLWAKADSRISEEVKMDLRRNNAFWNKYDGWLERASTDLNDAYLKANGQQEGIQSYGRMVDLLLASIEFYKTF